MKSSNIAFQSSKYVLLLGAGFTKNFGGPLAIEMWEKIFNHKQTQSQPRIKKLMMEYFDYELIYTKIMEGPYNSDEKKAIDIAIKDAYKGIDQILQKYAGGVPFPVNLSEIVNFINRFRENGPKHASGNLYSVVFPFTDNKSFIFTLNQDLFFERLYDNFELFIPGLKKNEEWFDSTFRRELNESDFCTLPDCTELSHIKSKLFFDHDFFLVKLHGSYNWKSSDGTQKMVTGRGKKEQIENEPLLKFYYDIFEEVLSQQELHLLVIGYGFADEHVNRVLANSIQKSGLKICVISPEKPYQFKENLFKNTKYGDRIWQGISGYFPYRLRDIFPENFTKTQEAEKLIDLFFD
jgi:hypothetical protein